MNIKHKKSCGNVFKDLEIENPEQEVIKFKMEKNIAMLKETIDDLDSILNVIWDTMLPDEKGIVDGIGKKLDIILQNLKEEKGE